MSNESERKEWEVLSDAILTGMTDWRMQHPKATLREIERSTAPRYTVAIPCTLFSYPATPCAVLPDQVLPSPP
jgi:hypothetical protein